jgi:hypothetical protein
MWSYFRGWKRKFGVLMLIVACVLIAMWLRCQFVGFAFQFPSGAVQHMFIAAPRGFAWKTEQEIDGAKNIVRFERRIMSFPIGPQSRIWPSSELLQKSCSSYLCGVHFVEGENPVASGGSVLERIVLIEHWVIVLPLSILSALCLLTKPRAKPARMPESVHA